MDEHTTRSRFLQGNFAPWRMEGEALDLEVTGEVPRALNGVLYRNGPNPQFPPREGHYHWFLGDGMVHALRFEDGRVDYRNRWVRTENFRLEREAHRALFGRDFAGTASDPSVSNVKRNVANTNIVWHAGRLLALEEGNPPVAMDPDTLDTHGPFTWDGRLRGPMTAHPKIEPDGRMHFFGYMAMGPGTPQISYNVVDTGGALVRQEMFEAPYTSMVHDFITTENYVIFPIFPATIDAARIMKGGPVIAWDPTQPTCIGIMPKSGTTADIRWFTGDPAYVFHPLNAHETADGRIVADVMKYERVPLFPDAEGNRPAPDLADAAARLVRWTFDPAAASSDYAEEALDDLPGEFPRFDERHVGRPYRHGYYGALTRAPSPAGDFDAIVHFDLGTGRRRVWNAGEHSFVAEPIFVPRAAGAEEGDGFLVLPVYRAAEDRSDVVVLDATDIEAGPLAVVKLPHRIPYGFHGNWRPLEA
jgi:carotenoid cleavage dioxygenase